MVRPPRPALLPLPCFPACFRLRLPPAVPHPLAAPFPRHVVIGEAFGFEVTHQLTNMLYMYFGGQLAVLVWKCS